MGSRKGTSRPQLLHAAPHTSSQREPKRSASLPTVQAKLIGNAEKVAAKAPAGDDTEPIETKLRLTRESITELKKLQTIHLAENSKKSKAKLTAKNEEVVKIIAEVKEHIDMYERRTKIDKKMSPAEKTSRAATAKN